MTAVQKHGRMVTGRETGNHRGFLSLTRWEVTKDKVSLSWKQASMASLQGSDTCKKHTGESMGEILLFSVISRTEKPELDSKRGPLFTQRPPEVRSSKNGAERKAARASLFRWRWQRSYR